MAFDLTGVDEKIKRANEHIADLKGRIADFEATNPYELVEQRDPDDPERHQGIIRIHRPIPPEIPLVTGDAIHNLRTAFDHLACAAVRGAGGHVTPKTEFPIWRKAGSPTAQEYEAIVVRKVEGAPKVFIEALLTLQPYEGGHHEPLWAIDYLDITDKHKLLIEAFSSYAKLVQWAGSLGMGIKPDVHVQPLKDGDELFGGPAKHHQKVDVEIEIAFGEPAVLVGEPLVPALTDLVETTTDVIDQLRRVL